MTRSFRSHTVLLIDTIGAGLHDKVDATMHHVQGLELADASPQIETAIEAFQAAADFDNDDDDDLER